MHSVGGGLGCMYIALLFLPPYLPNIITLEPNCISHNEWYFQDLRRPDGIALSMSKGKSQNTSIRDVKVWDYTILLFFHSYFKSFAPFNICQCYCVVLMNRLMFWLDVLYLVHSSSRRTAGVLPLLRRLVRFRYVVVTRFKDLLTVNNGRSVFLGSISMWF